MSIVMVFENYICSLFDLLTYRSLANCPWTRSEVVHIAEQLIKGTFNRIKGYRDLCLSSIAHRDIRASKVFLRSRSRGSRSKDV